MRYALLAILLLGVVGCGGGTVPPPGQNNGTKSNPGTGPGVVEKPGQSYATEFKAEHNKAKAAWSQFGKDKSPASYAKTGAHIYKALTYKIMHSRNKHDTNKLPNVTDLNRMYADWRKTKVDGDWQSDAAYTQAFKEYQALGAE